jgi:hypothetical protein
VTTPVLRDLDPGDHGEVLQLNEASVHFLAPLDAAKLERIVALTSWARVVDLNGTAVAFAWAIPAGRAYWSPFYGWFDQKQERFGRFLYLDRIVVAESARRRGLATLLYDDLERTALERRHEHVTCEVDLEPRNDPSLAFHSGRGYEEVGELDARPDAAHVRLLAKRSG